MSSPPDSPRATVHAISDRAGDRVVYGIACTELVGMLRGAARGDSDPRLAGALEAIRREWLGIARARFPRLGEDAQDAAQMALVKLLSPDKIDSLSDPSLVDRWARSLFVNTVLDVLRDGQRRGRRIVTSQDEDESDGNDLLARLPSPEPDPEDQIARSERLEILRRALAQLDVAWLRYVEDLPEQEVAARLGSTRVAVASRLKRFRRWLRDHLEDAP